MPADGALGPIGADETHLALARTLWDWDEALFTLGDKPELRYRVARDELAALGCATTVEYLER